MPYIKAFSRIILSKKWTLCYSGCVYTKEQQQFLGLSSKELQLLKVLEKSTFNTSEVSIKAALPRITALRLLTRLHKRGFVSRHKAAREVRWSLVSPKLVHKRLELGQEEREKTAFGKLIPLSDIASVSIYRGHHEMLLSNQKFIQSGHAGERLYCIEPNAIWKHVAKVPAADWVHLNGILKQKQIIAEIILEPGYEKALGYVEDLLSESFFAISKDTRVMPAEVMQTPVEILIFRDQALLADWEQLIAVEITSASMVKTLKGLFITLQNISTPITV
jgi:hypothetical protein